MYLTGIHLLLLVAATLAAPRAHTFHQIHQHDHEIPRPVAGDFWPQDDDIFRYGEPEESAEEAYPDVVYDEQPFQGAVGVDININPDTVNVLSNDSVTNAIFRDLERRIAEDVQRMQQDLILFRRLFGQRPAVPQVPPSFLLPWGIPDDTDDAQDDDKGFDLGIFGHDDSEEDDGGEDSDESFGLFGRFPFLGMDRPVFSDLPELPGVGFINPASLPGNYSNETSVVHSVEGGQVHVNNTVNKESGDNFNSFFHHQVIHFRPGTEEEERVPEDRTPEGPATEVHAQPEVTTVVPEVEDESFPDPFRPAAIPEVFPEGSSDTHPESDDVHLEKELADEEDFEISNMLSQDHNRKKTARSLRQFNPIVFPDEEPVPNALPQAANYVVSQALDDEDAEEVSLNSDENKPADLSKDTRVNYVPPEKSGMAKPDPDAEVFNYHLVLEDERASRRDD